MDPDSTLKCRLTEKQCGCMVLHISQPCPCTHPWVIYQTYRQWIGKPGVNQYGKCRIYCANKDWAKRETARLIAAGHKAVLRSHQ